MFRIERDCPAAIRPSNFCFGLHFGSCFCSPFGGKFTLLRLILAEDSEIASKSFSSTRTDFAKVKYDRDNIRWYCRYVLLHLYLCPWESLRSIAWAQPGAWYLYWCYWAIPLFTAPEQNDDREWFRVLQLSNGPCHKILLNKNGYTPQELFWGSFPGPSCI